MAEWLKRRLEGLLDNILFSGLVAAGVTMLAIIKSLPTQLIVAIAILTFFIILVIIRVIWTLKFKNKIDTPRGILKIGAKVKEIKTAGYYDSAFGGQSEGDKQVTVDVILALSKPTTLYILALELWGKRFEAKIQREVAPFDLMKLTPIKLTSPHTYTANFHVPKEVAIDTKEARIYILTGNQVDWFSEPFAINF